MKVALEALVQKRLASGAYASAEEIVRGAFEAREAENGWTEEERLALDKNLSER